MAVPTKALPGLSLGPTNKDTAGPGTQDVDGIITALIAGTVTVETQRNEAGKTTSTIVVSGRRDGPAEQRVLSRYITSFNAFPQVGDIVLARVTRLQMKQANVSILVVGETVCANEFSGVLRREDIRGWEIDRVVVGSSFRVGDIVRASVISIGDQHSFYLSTARNELGVLLATSESGNTMYPISWKEFQDPVTGKHETRKVAKPI